MWHWPLLIFGRSLHAGYHEERPPREPECSFPAQQLTGLQRVLLLGLAVLLSVGTLYLVEAPLRNHKWPRTPHALSACCVGENRRLQHQ